VSILHRVSGVLMFVLLPFIIWMFDTSLTSRISFAKFKSVFNIGAGFLPAGSSSWWRWPDLGLPAPLHRRRAPPVDGREPHRGEQAIRPHLGPRSRWGLRIVLTVMLGAKLFGLY
jgi:succinate dehydrogenase / fumarate reductase cytochrome b subunit